MTQEQQIQVELATPQVKPKEETHVQPVEEQRAPEISEELVGEVMETTQEAKVCC